MTNVIISKDNGIVLTNTRHVSDVIKLGNGKHAELARDSELKSKRQAYAPTDKKIEKVTGKLEEAPQEQLEKKTTKRNVGKKSASKKVSENEDNVSTKQENVTEEI